MIHSFLLIGQSNMAGRGNIADAHCIDTSHVKIMRNGRWMEMFRPVNPDRKFSGVSLGESFGERYAAKYGVDAGLICCADGGTSLDQWQKGGFLYEHAIYQARLAMRESVIVGILWHQGEADCATELYTTYEERFARFRKDLCDDLNLHNVPFLIGGLGDFLPDCPLDDKLKNYYHLNNIFKKIAADNLLIGYVPAEGLGSNPDMLHFSADALYEFGIRYFDEYVRIRGDAVIDGGFAENSESIRSMELL